MFIKIPLFTNFYCESVCVFLFVICRFKIDFFEEHVVRCLRKAKEMLNRTFDSTFLVMCDKKNAAESKVSVFLYMYQHENRKYAKT